MNNKIDNSQDYKIIILDGTVIEHTFSFSTKSIAIEALNSLNNAGLKAKPLFNVTPNVKPGKMYGTN